MEDTTNYLVKILIEANAVKVERAIEEVASRCAEGNEYIAVAEEVLADAPVEGTVNIRTEKSKVEMPCFFLLY